jgi:hypothetical protein
VLKHLKERYRIKRHWKSEQCKLFKGAVSPDLQPSVSVINQSHLGYLLTGKIIFAYGCEFGAM